MLRNFNLASALPVGGQWREPRFLVRAALGVLLAANLVAAGILLFPPGGSADDLERQLVSLQSQVQSKRALLESTRQHAAAVELGRSEGDQFLADYFLALRTAPETLLSQLTSAAEKSKIKPKGDSLSVTPVEGSDTLSMLTITGNYEGTYADLLHFVNEIDKSPRLLIIESLNAAPQPNSQILTISMKLETFVRDDSGPPLAASDHGPMTKLTSGEDSLPGSIR